MKRGDIRDLDDLTGGIVRLSGSLTRMIRDMGLTLQATVPGDPMTLDEINALATKCGSLRKVLQSVEGHIETTERIIGRALSDSNEARMEGNGSLRAGSAQSMGPMEPGS